MVLPVRVAVAPLVDFSPSVIVLPQRRNDELCYLTIRSFLRGQAAIFPQDFRVFIISTNSGRSAELVSNVAFKSALRSTSTM
jgi:hypothetical protein